jgi:hypothetical protein
VTHNNETDGVIETTQPKQKILAMSMITMFLDEMAANRIETQKQINLLQTQMIFFQVPHRGAQGGGEAVK